MNELRPILNHPPSTVAQPANMAIPNGPTVVVGRYPTRAKADQALTELQHKFPDREYHLQKVQPWRIVVS